MHKTQRNNWITLSVLAAALFIKSVFFRLWTGLDALTVGQLIAAHLAVGAAAVALALLVWLPRRWPSAVLLIVTDLWFIAGIWYYEANSLSLDWQAIKTITELQGFESSILSYLEWKQLVLPITTIVVLWVLHRLPFYPIRRSQWIQALVVVLILTVGASAGRFLSPLSEQGKQRFNAEKTHFIATHSPFVQAISVVTEAIQDGLFQWNSSRPLTPREEAIMAEIYRPEVPPIPPTGHLVYILVESLETWALEAKDIHGHLVGEHLLSYVNSHPVLYVPSVETHQIYGRSGDGQLTTQTGLLPISSGVACRQYGENTYPNLAHFYPEGAVFNPYHVPVWNQNVVTYSYGFKQLISSRLFRNQTDSIVIEHSRIYLEKATSPCAVLTLTIDTHTPFQSRWDSVLFDAGYTDIEQNYLRSVHYTDRQLGRFLAWADTAATMRGATIVITADHNHFPRENGHGLCPLIIAAPCITQSVTYPAALQMDIFPTVLHAIGQDDYAWRGFGIDLLSPQAPELLNHRPIPLQEAYSLSEKLIHSNFFAR